MIYCSEEILFPRHPMALRLSSCLMVGILRVYRQQTHYVYGESSCTHSAHTASWCVCYILWSMYCIVESKTVWQRIKSAYEKTVPQTDLPGGHPRCT